MCTLIWYLGFVGTFLNPILLLSWMFEHDFLDTCCFGCLICMCLLICICTCSTQFSMFHMERSSRNTLIIIIIIIVTFRNVCTHHIVEHYDAPTGQQFPRALQKGHLWNILTSIEMYPSRSLHVGLCPVLPLST